MRVWRDAAVSGDGVVGRWCTWRLEVEIAPNPRLLCDDRLATDGIWASGRQRPVQHRHADGSLGLLGGEAAGPQPGSDQRLVATHCRFYWRTLAVVGGDLPAQAALFRDHRQMTITLCRHTRIAARDSR